MDHQYLFTYLPCQTCSAKIHCDQCSERIAASLMQFEGIRHAEVDTAKKQLAVSGTFDTFGLEEYMEELGVFIA